MIRRFGTPFVIVLVVAAAGLAAALPPAATAQDDPDVVTTVNGTPISREAFHGRVRFVRWQYLQEIAKLHELTAGNLGLAAGRVLTLLDGLRDPDALGEAVLSQMEDELLALEAATLLQAEPTPDDVRAKHDTFFGLWTGVEPDDLAADAAAQRFIADWYAAAQSVSGLDRDAIDAIFATEARWDALYTLIAARAPTEELTVHSRHILCRFAPDEPEPVPSPSEAQRRAALDCIRAAQARLAGDEPFADVAADLSGDAASAARGGDLGWVPLSYLVDGYAAAVETARPNTVIGPVETEYGLHLIEVLEREMRPLSEPDRAQVQSELFGAWLDRLRQDATITRSADWAEGIPAEPALNTLSPDVLEAIDRLEQAG